MTATLQFETLVKTSTGTGSARSVRRNGRIPGIISNLGKGNIMVEMPSKEFLREYHRGGIKTKLLELKLNNEVMSAIITDIQLDPVTDVPIHIDFRSVDENTVIKIQVPLHIINENRAPGIRKGGVVNLVKQTLAILCHPSDAPRHIDIDVAELDIGDNIHVNDLNLPQGVQPVDKSNPTIVSIIGRAAETEAATTTEGATTTEQK